MTRYRCTLCSIIFDGSSLAPGQFHCPADGAPLVPVRTANDYGDYMTLEPKSESVDDLEVVESDDGDDFADVEGVDPVPVDSVPADAEPLSDSDPIPLDPFAAGGDPFALPPDPLPHPPQRRHGGTPATAPRGTRPPASTPSTGHRGSASAPSPPPMSRPTPVPRPSSASTGTRSDGANPSQPNRGRRPSNSANAHEQRTNNNTVTPHAPTSPESASGAGSGSRARGFTRPPSMRQIRNRSNEGHQKTSIGEAANQPLRKTPTTRGISVSQLADDPDEFPPGPFGPFELLRLLGRGAMGTVYLAQWVENPGVEIAVKVLSLARTTETRHRKRFQREAEICRRLRHPNLVEVYDVGEADGRLYMAMELIHGRPISNHIKDKGTMDPREVVPLLVQSLKGVAEFHAAGIIHRDLKPDNILVRNDGTAKVTDFGLARLQEPDATKLTAAGKAVGTPYFMAPEQVLQPETVDHRVDIYAIGITLYHSLTGAYPYDGRRANDVLLNIAREQPIHIWSRRADLPQSIAQIVMRLIARDPSQRYPDANSAAQGLQEALDLAYG